MKRLGKLILMTVAFMTLAVASNAQTLQIKGSDTLINMVQRLAEVYMEKNPGKYIAVTGGGSGTGIAALINGKCDIANASREMKQKEVDSAMANGITPKRVVVAIDGVCIIVNQNNPAMGLTMDQIGKIYRGEITNWQEVGGNNVPVTLYGRQSNSGTYQFLQEEVLKGDYSPRMNQMNGNAQIMEAVKTDASGIGYVGVGYAKQATGVTVLKVAKTAGGNYVSPMNPDDVRSRVYPVSRPLNQYINGSATGAVKDFLAFELSEEGQEIVEEEGFVAIPDEYKEYNKKAGL